MKLTTIKLQEINLPIDEITTRWNYREWIYRTVKLPTMIFPAMKLLRWFYGLPLDEITNDEITGDRTSELPHDKITDVENNQRWNYRR